MAIIKISLILLVVIVTLTTAILLNYAAKQNDIFSITALLIIFVVVVINFIKFKVWGSIYKRFNLSESYPLTSLFFPLIYVVAIYNGEAILEMSKVFGVILILFGIYIMNGRKVNL